MTSTLTKKRFYEMMQESYKARANAGEIRMSEAIMAIAFIDTDKGLARLWAKIRRARMTESEVRALLKLNKRGWKVLKGGAA